MTITDEKLAEIRTRLEKLSSDNALDLLTSTGIKLDRLKGLLDRLDASEAENARLRKALKPFAKISIRELSRLKIATRIGAPEIIAARAALGDA